MPARDASIHGVLLVLLTVFALSARAHHSRTGFDAANPIRLTGTVTEFRWANPHVLLRIQLDSGEDWLLEAHSVQGVASYGWQPDTFQVGDEISVGANPDRNPDNRYALLLWVLTADGVALNGMPGSVIPQEYAAGETPQPASGGRAGRQDLSHLTPPSTDFSGNWLALEARFGGPPIAGVEGDPGGPAAARRGMGMGAAPPGGAGMGGAPPGGAGMGTAPPNRAATGAAPLVAQGNSMVLTELGLAQRETVRDPNDPTYHCIESQFPNFVTTPTGVRIDRYEDRLVVQKESTSVVNTIWLDESAVPADYVPGRAGLAVGRFEDEATLLFSIANFAPATWGLVRGVDSSAGKEIHGRMELAGDGKAIDISWTTTDPVYLAEPYDDSIRLTKQPDREFVVADCDPESSAAFLEFQ